MPQTNNHRIHQPRNTEIEWTTENLGLSDVIMFTIIIIKQKFIESLSKSHISDNMKTFLQIDFSRYFTIQPNPI